MQNIFFLILSHTTTFYKIKLIVKTICRCSPLKIDNLVYYLWAFLKTIILIIMKFAKVPLYKKPHITLYVIWERRYNNDKNQYYFFHCTAGPATIMSPDILQSVKYAYIFRNVLYE